MQDHDFFVTTQDLHFVEVHYSPFDNDDSSDSTIANQSMLTKEIDKTVDVRPEFDNSPPKTSIKTSELKLPVIENSPSKAKLEDQVADLTLMVIEMKK